jgi:hypothetical protein
MYGLVLISALNSALRLIKRLILQNKVTLVRNTAETNGLVLGTGLSNATGFIKKIKHLNNLRFLKYATFAMEYRLQRKV